jgi:hypothetical protein
MSGCWDKGYRMSTDAGHVADAVREIEALGGEHVPRASIEAVARIMGPASASSMALKDADAHNGAVLFFRIGAQVVVVKAKP